MEDILFVPWPSISRLFRSCVITEKIDGTNAAIGIVWDSATDGFVVYAQSRKKLIYPGKTTDNAGFATWVEANRESLIVDLGEGLHFGEWWGQGIQRNYGMAEKHFSLFNTSRWKNAEFVTPNLSCVPVLHEGTFDTVVAGAALAALKKSGSVAAPGFMNPEGIVVFHVAANLCFKVTIDGDDASKFELEAKN